MVKANGKYNVQNSSSFHMSQLVLWDGLHLNILTPDNKESLKHSASVSVQ